MPRTRTPLTAAEREKSINDTIRIRAARAAFASAIAAAMLANVAAGMAPRWNRSASPESWARWEAFEHLSGLLSQAVNVEFASELRELLVDASAHVPHDVIRTGNTLAATVEAVAAD